MGIVLILTTFLLIFICSAVSGVQAVAVVVISARLVITCNDVMKDEDPYLHSYIWFGVSYFPYDIIMMYIGNTYSDIHKEHHTSHSRSFLSYFKRDCVMVLHHIIFLLVGFPVAEVGVNIFQT